MIDFKAEELNQILVDEMKPLLMLHYKEISAFQDIELKPDFAKYIKLFELGVIKVFTARDETACLVGYAVFFVQFNLHYSDSLQAVQDVIYIEKSQRGAGIGKAFISFCDSELKALGCQLVYHHVKNKHNFGPMLETMGYQLVDLIYARRLD